MTKMTDPKGTRRLLAQRVTDTSCENSGLQNLFKKKKKEFIVSGTEGIK